MRLSRGLGERGHLYLFQGYKGTKGLKFMGTGAGGEQRQFWGTGNIGNQ